MNANQMLRLCKTLIMNVTLIAENQIVQDYQLIKNTDGLRLHVTSKNVLFVSLIKTIKNTFHPSGIQ